jgi:hypothetical protein
MALRIKNYMRDDRGWLVRPRPNTQDVPILHGITKLHDETFARRLNAEWRGRGRRPVANVLEVTVILPTFGQGVSQ